MIDREVRAELSEHLATLGFDSVEDAFGAAHEAVAMFGNSS